MTVLLNSNTSVMIQGMTGKEGQRALQYMRSYNVKVVAGVTPGKGGQDVEGIPVYNSVQEALAVHPEINVSSLFVPPKFVFSAAQEAIKNQIPLIHIFAEGVPVQDTAKLLELAKVSKSRIVGPSSIGFAAPGIGKIGSIGGDTNDSFLAPTKGKGVAILSKSGGMSNETAALLTAAGIPQSFVIGIGGDRLIGTTYADLLPDLQADETTGAVVIIGEIGGAYEEMLAAKIKELRFAKPVVAFISGQFAETLPQGVSFGHAGAIVSKTQGTREGKISALRDAGVKIAHNPEEIVGLLQPVFE